MPITKSAKKALCQSRKKAAVNKSIRTRAKSVVAKVRKLPTTENLKAAYSVLDKTASRGVIKKEKADRLKSRLTKFLNQTSGQKQSSKRN